MITTVLLNRVLKLVSIRKDSNSDKQVARIYDLKSTVPENILHEKEKNIFHDDLTGEKFHLTPTGLIGI